MSIHPTAIVDPGAQIGSDVRIGAFSVIGAHVTIGDGCRIHHQVTIDGHTTLGKGCEVFPQALIGLPPQDLKFNGEDTLLEIGDNNIIRELVTIHPGTGNGGGITRIGNNNFLLIGVHVAHDCIIGEGCVIANYVQFAGHVHVEDKVNIGGHSAVHHFVTVGKHAFIGGMTRVSADVPPFMVCVAARGTRSEIRMVNGVGLQRSGYSDEDINALKQAFMKMYSRKARASGTAIRDRVEELLETPSLNPHVEYLSRFLMRSFEHGRNGRYLESLRKDAVHRSTWRPGGKHQVAIEVVGGGSVSQGRDISTDPAVQVFELTAMAHDGWRFAGWNGGLSGEANPVLLVVDADKKVTATFTDS